MSITFGTIDTHEDRLSLVHDELKQLIATHKERFRAFSKEEKRARKHARRHYETVVVKRAIDEHNAPMSEEDRKALIEEWALGQFEPIYLNKGPDCSIMQQEFAAEIPSYLRLWEKNQTR